MKELKNKIKSAIVRRLIGVGDVSYSQEGEDILLKKYLTIMKPNKKIHYVDVGAHHPTRFSNTYIFYRAGGSGLNIDASPGSMIPFKRERERDVNLELGVGEIDEKKMFYSFTEPAMNTFDDLIAEMRIRQGYKLLNKCEIHIKPLSCILDKHWLEDTCIDFMTIDTEGYELQVLMSNNWEKYRPCFVLVEALQVEYLENICDLDLVKYMEKNNYKLISRLFNTIIFKEITCMEFSRQ